MPLLPLPKERPLRAAPTGPWLRGRPHYAKSQSVEMIDQTRGDGPTRHRQFLEITLRVNPTSLRCSLFLRPDPKWIRLAWSSQATSRSRREPQVPTALNISQSCRRGAQCAVCNARRKKSKSAFGRRVCFSKCFAGVKCREEKCPLGQLLHHLANIKMKVFFSM